MVNKGAMRHVSLRAIRVSSVGITSPLFHTHLFICHQIYIFSEIDSVIKQHANTPTQNYELRMSWFSNLETEKQYRPLNAAFICGYSESNGYAFLSAD
jgi:hypothetical protein